MVTERQSGAVWSHLSGSHRPTPLGAPLTGNARRSHARGGTDTTVRLWSIGPEQVAARICAIAGQPITPTEWHKYVPGAAYQPPCG